MTTRYRLLEPMLVTQQGNKQLSIPVLKRVTLPELARIARETHVWVGAPTHYAVFPEPDPACYLPLVEPKKKET
jgi:hypothetical protein